MQQFRPFTMAAALLVLMSTASHAGSMEGGFDREHRGQGYAFFAPGGVFGEGGHTGTGHIGGGGEVLFYRGIGAGAEIGYLLPCGDFSSGIGILSADGSYHFMRGRKVSPFLTAGYSLGFRNGHGNLVNFGGGIHWWMKERLGLRLEFRDHVYGIGASMPVHFLGGRIGIAFR